MGEKMMIRVAKRALLAVTLVLAGCTAVVPHEVAPTRTTIDNAYTIEPQVAWSAMRVGNDEIWTIDGPRLEFLSFVVAENGKPLFEVGDAGLERRMPVYRSWMTPTEIHAGLERRMPVYRSWMTPIEIREAIEKSFITLGYEQVQTVDFRPADFGSQPGYRLDFTATTRNGLDQRGVVLATEKRGKLYLIAYVGAKLYYFDRHLPAVEQMFQSIKMLPDYASCSAEPACVQNKNN